MTIHSEKSMAVIGAGLLGLCSALQAQRKGFKVTIFDHNPVGKGASFGNGGYLATELIEPLATPSVIASALALWVSPKGPLGLPIQYWHKSFPWVAKFVAAARPAQLTKSQQGLKTLNHQALDAWRRCLIDIDGISLIKNNGYLLLWVSTRKMNVALKQQKTFMENGVNKH